MKITQFDKPTLRYLREEINKSLAILSQETGLVFAAGNASFNPNTATMKLNISTVSTDGTVASPEITEFQKYACLFGLQPKDLGRTFNYAGNQYTICGLKIRSSKFPILAKNKNGKQYKFPADIVKHELKSE